MKQQLRRVLRQVPLARAANDIRIRRDLKIVEALPTFAPNSAGHAEVRSVIALQAAAQTPVFLAELADQVGARELPTVAAADFGGELLDRSVLARLDEVLRRHGSDKSTDHNYHLVYAAILGTLPEAPAVLEVGIGTNNEAILSTMGADGRPGASLRTFRDVLPQAQVFGADLDRDILFSEDRISTFYVDQTDSASVRDLESRLPESLDLVIDDGLHAPNANLQILMLGLRRIAVGGWVVIEDIIPAAHELWRSVAALLPDRYETTYVSAKGGDMLVVRRTV